MADDRLRDLERVAERGRPGAMHLRRAVDLCRAGRYDDALEAVLPLRDDPEVRGWIVRAVGVQPAARWGFHDVHPVVSRPRVKWSRPGLGAPERRCWMPSFSLIASPLGVIGYQDPAVPVVVDPETGRERWTLPWPPLTPYKAGHGVMLMGNVVIPRSPELRAFDLWTGDTIYTASVNESDRVTILGGRGGGIFQRPRAGLLMTDAFLDEQHPPVREGTWSLPFPEFGGFNVILTTSEIVVVAGDTRRTHDVLAVDRRTGGIRWRMPGGRMAGDEEGLVLEQDDALVALDQTGRVRWRVADRRPMLRALAPDFVVVKSSVVEPVDPRFYTLVTRDRASGALLGVVGPAGLGVVAVARNVIYFAAATESRTLSAVRVDGTRLWSIPLSDLTGTELRSVVPLDRRLYVLTLEGTLTCLEQEGGE